MNAVFWRKDKYTAVDKDTFWLSETPDTQSKYDGAGCNRICTWVLLRETETGKLLLHMNTHLDNASSEAANFGARLIMQCMQALSEKYPQAQIVLTGDFKQNRGMAAYNAVAAELSDTLSAFPDRADGTYQNRGETDRSEPIDFIFVSDDFNTLNYEILDDIPEGYVSDHYGVYAEFSLE